jgi:hypothetical protein
MAGSDSPVYMLVGGAGVPNFGDELIMWKWLDWLRSNSHIPDHKIVLEINHRKVGKSLGYGDFYNTFVSGDVASARAGNRSQNFSQMFDRGYDFFSSHGGYSGARRLTDRLSRASVFHLHGGGYLNDYWPFHAFSLGLACAAKNKFGCKAIATGLGLGPFSSGESTSRIRTATEIFDYFEVRDQVSKDLAGERAVLGLDDVFLSSVQHKTVSGRTLHLSLIGKSDDNLLKASVSKELIDSFDKVYFWVCSPQDAENYAALGSRYREIIPLTMVDLLGKIPVGVSNYMLTERFHPHLIGARLGFGGAFVSRSGYYDAKHGSVIELGSKFEPVSLGDDVAERFDQSTPSRLMAAKDPSEVASKNIPLVDLLCDV